MPTEADAPAPPPPRSVTDPRVVLAWARRLIVIGCLIGVGYLWRRFDSFALETSCSPVSRIAPGTRLWIDRKPPRYHVGDLAFFLGPEGRIHFAEVRELEGEGARLWLETDDPLCPGLDSTEIGWVAADRMQGRVVFASGQW